jgi:hypothetical protein
MTSQLIPGFTHMPSGLGAPSMIGAGGSYGQPSLPGSYQSFLPGMSRLNVGVQTFNEITNEPISTKVAIKYGTRSKEETHAGLGPGHLVWAKTLTAALAWEGQAASGSQEIEEPHSMSSLNRWLGAKRQRVTLGSKKRAPEDFRFVGAQTTQNKPRFGPMARWAEGDMNLISGRFISDLPNIGLAHRDARQGASVFAVWQRIKFQPDDYTLPVYSTSSKSDNSLSVQKLLSELKKLGADATQSDFDEFKSLSADIVDFTYQRASGSLTQAEEKAYKELIDQRNDRMRALFKDQVEYKRAAEKLYEVDLLPDPSAASDGMQWRVTPYVSYDGGTPPKSLYETDMCIGRHEPLYRTLRTRPVEQFTADYLAKLARTALFPKPSDETDWQKAFLSLPATEAILLSK